MTKSLQRRVEALERKRDSAILVVIRPQDDGTATITRFVRPNKAETREISAVELAKLLASEPVIEIKRTYVEK